MHSTSTTSGSHRRSRAAWRRRPRAFASALFVCLSLSVAVPACSVDYELGTLDEPPSLGASGAPLGIVATDGARLYDFDAVTAQFGPGRPLAGCDLPIVELTRRERGELFAAGWAHGVGALYRVRETGECFATARFSIGSSWAIAFVPPPSGLVSGTLIGDEGGRLVTIDVLGAQTEILKRPTMGQVTGDIVVTADGDAWRSLSDALGRVSLQRIDPRTGVVRDSFVVASGDPLDGLVEADGALIGFTHAGKVVRLSVVGGAVEIAPIATTGGPATFTGAASAWAGGAPR